MCIYTHINMFLCLSLSLSLSLSTYIYIYIYIHIHVYMYTCIHVYMYIYIYIYNVLCKSYAACNKRRKRHSCRTRPGRLGEDEVVVGGVHRHPLQASRPLVRVVEPSDLIANGRIDISRACARRHAEHVISACLCVCASVHVCVHVRVRARVRTRVHAHVHICVNARNMWTHMHTLRT